MSELLRGPDLFNLENPLIFMNQTLEVMESPSKTLDVEQRKALAIELSPLTARGFLRDSVTDELVEDVYNHVIDCDRLSIVRDMMTGVPTAFIAVSLREFQGSLLYHLEGIIVDREYRANGFAPYILQKDIEAVGAEIVAFHTQSRLMQGLGAKVCIYDDELALEVAALIGTRNQEGLVDVGRYGGQCLYGDVEAFEVEAISEIDYLQGDARVFAGRVA